jgi:hypothetical protein
VRSRCGERDRIHVHPRWRVVEAGAAEAEGGAVRDDNDVDTVARALFRAHDDAACIGCEPSHAFELVIDGWCAAARAAIALGARPRVGDPRARLEEMLGADSTNFLGTGLTLREAMQLYSAEKLSRSWVLQPREERRRRLAAVVRLSAELELLRQTESFATRLAEMAIESVIEGDWKMVEEWAEHFAFGDECDEIRVRGSAVYATFRELLLQAVRAGKEGPV